MPCRCDIPRQRTQDKTRRGTRQDAAHTGGYFWGGFSVLQATSARPPHSLHQTSSDFPLTGRRLWQRNRRMLAAQPSSQSRRLGCRCTLHSRSSLRHVAVAHLHRPRATPQEDLASAQQQAAYQQLLLASGTTTILDMRVSSVHQNGLFTKQPVQKGEVCPCTRCPYVHVRTCCMGTHTSVNRWGPYAHM